MGGGLMPLVAYGAQDIYLTGNPQITFFKVVYRRHTNFSMECIQQTVNGTSTVSDSANSGTVTVSRNGDLPVNAMSDATRIQVKELTVTNSSQMLHSKSVVSKSTSTPKNGLR